MRMIIFLLSVPLVCFAAINRNPPNCSTRPCVYTLTCAAATCNTTENSELQTVFNEANLGDTIYLEAGRTWTSPATNGYQISARPGSGTLLVTTTGISNLPPLGTRITPHYIPYMAAIKPGANIAFQVLAGANPAKNITFRGIYVPITSGSEGNIKIGSSGTKNSDNDLCDNIQLQQIIVKNTDWGVGPIGQHIGIGGGKRVIIQDSYLQGAYDATAGRKEKQAIGVTICNDCKYINNALLDIAGENIMFGGTGTAYDGADNSGEFAYNALLNHKERIPTLTYAAGQRYMKGVIVVSAGTRYRAQASCVSTGTIANDACNWTTISERRHMKNMFEIKNGYRLFIHHNLFDGFWLADGGGADQYEAVTFKVSGCPQGSGGNCRCVAPYSGVCSINGNVVTSSLPLPDIYNCDPGDTQANVSCCGTINIDGKNYTVTDFDLTDRYRLYVAETANLTNVTCTMCQTDCTRSKDKENVFEYNVVRNAPQPFQFVQSGGADYNDLGGHRVANNLFYDISCSEFAQAGYGCASWTLGRSPLLCGGQAVWTRILNNTIIPKDSSFSYTIHFDGTYNCRGIPRGRGTCPAGQFPIDGTIIIRNNIMAKGSVNQLQSNTPPEGSNAQVLTTKMWRGALTNREWYGNILAGADVSAYPGATRNLCPTSASCAVNFDYDDPNMGRLFQNFSQKNFKVMPNYAKLGWDGEGIGARWEKLPLMMKPSTGGVGIDVSKNGNVVTLSWLVNPDMSHIGCSVVLATHWDMDTLYGAVPPLPTVVTPGRREWTMNLPNGNYYMEVHCGSIERVEFSLP